MAHVWLPETGGRAAAIRFSVLSSGYSSVRKFRLDVKPGSHLETVTELCQWMKLCLPRKRIHYSYMKFIRIHLNSSYFIIHFNLNLLNIVYFVGIV